MAESAFVVVVQEAEPFVGSLRGRLDPSAGLGMPAHVTLLYPFMDPARITRAVLDKAGAAFSSAAAFDFHLSGIRRFPGVLYLAPEPAAPFVALTETLFRQFPDYPPYGGRHASIIPHLTVAQAEEAEHGQAEHQLAASLPRQGISASCREVVLIENSSGQWRPLDRFSLVP